MISQAFGLAQNMGDQNNGIIRFDVLKKCFDGFARNRIECRGGFIGQNDLWFNRKPSGQTQPLLLAN